MKKLMIGLVGVLAMVASAEVTSSNIVGYQNQKIPVNDRAMRSAATFVKTGDNPTDIKLSDIKQVTGDPADLVLCTYNDNVTRTAQYVFIAEDVATEFEIDSGWYILTNGDPDVEAGVQDVDLPLGQGCVINSGNSNAEYSSAGEVDSIVREFTIPINARKMMGNFLPRKIMLSELKQTTGGPADLVFCTYNNNVTRLAQYIYVASDVASEFEIDSGWYILEDGDPNLELGVQDFEIPSGQGFVFNSGNSDAILQFPTAM